MHLIFSANTIQEVYNGRSKCISHKEDKLVDALVWSFLVRANQGAQTRRPTIDCRKKIAEDGCASWKPGNLMLASEILLLRPASGPVIDLINNTQLKYNFNCKLNTISP